MSNVTPDTIKRLMVDCLLHAADDGCGAGDCYCLCGMDMPVWEVVRTLLIEANWIKVSQGHFVTVTPTGKAIVAECRQAAKAEQPA